MLGDLSIHRHGVRPGHKTIDNKALDHEQQARAILAGFIPENYFGQRKSNQHYTLFDSLKPLIRPGNY